MDRDDREQRTAFEKYLRKPGRRRLARVVDLFHEAVWGMARRASGNDEDARDIVQETWQEP
jgi:DNA-directed RNA polymerase specialized sigma24 family protein